MCPVTCMRSHRGCRRQERDEVQKQDLGLPNMFKRVREMISSSQHGRPNRKGSETEEQETVRLERPGEESVSGR